MMPQSFSKVDMARAFMWAAHGAINQRRKGTDEPYRVHPELALSILLQYSNPSEDEQCAILLHDVVEDTDLKSSDINRFFGYKVTRLVNVIGSKESSSEGNREERFVNNLNKLRNGPYEAILLKLADIGANASGHTLTSNFAKVWLDEKLRTLVAFKKDLEPADEELFLYTLSTVFKYVLEVFTDGEAKALFNRYVDNMAVHFKIKSFEKTNYERFLTLIKTYDSI